MSTAMTVARLPIMCWPSARKVVASYRVMVRPNDSQVPHITPATSTYNMMLTNCAHLTNTAPLCARRSPGSVLVGSCRARRGVLDEGQHAVGHEARGSHEAAAPGHLGH